MLVVCFVYTVDIQYYSLISTALHRNILDKKKNPNILTSFYEMKRTMPKIVHNKRDVPQRIIKKKKDLHKIMFFCIVTIAIKEPSTLYNKLKGAFKGRFYHTFFLFFLCFFFMPIHHSLGY